MELDPTTVADPATDIGLRVAAHRTRAGLKVSALARQIGVSASLISQIERGQSRPSVSTLFAIAEALDVPMDAFFRDGADRASPPTRAAAAAARCATTARRTSCAAVTAPASTSRAACAGSA